MAVNWHDLILAWLYDPPDVVHDLPGARARAADYASAALGVPVSETDLDNVRAKYISLLEGGLPIPPEETTAPSHSETPTSSACQGDFLTESGPQTQYIMHPLAGIPFQLPLALLQGSATQQIAATIADLTRQCSNAQSRFLALWRFLPERLAELSPGLALLPADARVPDPYDLESR